MARFDVYARAAEPGYMVDVQANLLSELNTRVVVPLLPVELAPRRADRLNPEFDIRGVKVSMVTQFMAAIPKSELKNFVTNVEQHGAEILDAIDFLHQGW